MERTQELKELFNSLDERIKKFINPMLEEIAFLEKHLTELKKYPFISVNPYNVDQQRTTSACNQYKELMQSYTGIVKMLRPLLQNGNSADVDPVAEFMKKIQNGNG